MATYVIVGAGLAGAKAAQTLREEGFDGEIVLIGAEIERPYERPPLSKGYLQGNSERQEIFVHEPGWYADNDVDLRLGIRVTRIETAHHLIRLGDGSRQPYDKLLIATGAVPRRLPGPAHYLRTVEDSEALRRRFAEGADVLIVGASWIGLETAAAARTAGCQVTVVEPEPTALNRALGQELGELFARLHASKGVDLRFGTAAAEITETGVRLSSGERLAADLVVVGIGAAPEVGLARDAGLDVGQGILTDASLRTSHPDVYAAGDVAEFFHPLYGRRIRVEHWANALHGGPVAARSMLGQEVVHDMLPYFYTDQYELGMEFSGDIEGHDEIVYRGDPESMEFITYWLRERRVIAGMNVNVWDVVDDIQELIKSGVTVHPKELSSG
ncbi:3-phenylpropionate/trans-cinnamate dioxygenase ferredoxin reductase subunit [Nonomuraea thailandensis]|uniref:3-phenylpropionate/trans-cinnamate dioxygenase ferredoxin reductase subunit n=1 Tax=Nonomuraea thailandensis TaxID=1188745 RepID=A0A9X2GKR4_9ACTN|nr:FAD-dependent oxidoreductase [Nonomuraea thailandensis]MCP2360636.1 3-phenylpropionate/trans-cinnamate dioxygenase ferredoxin reductase subunit [Nonomuraea thailandensis]